jgi:hypothetical protein
MSKKAKNNPFKKQKAKEPDKLDPRIEEIYEEEVEINCPVRGKIKQLVKIKRYRPISQEEVQILLIYSEETAESESPQE